MLRKVFMLITAGFLPLVALAEAPKIDPKNDWPWWRGPTRDNKTSTGTKPVTAFSEAKNVLWKSPVPGRGHASPTVVGKRIFLATEIDEGEAQAVIAYDRERGTQLWMHRVNQGNLPSKIHPKNTHASSTVASDGECVFAAFYNNRSIQVAAITVEGKPLWQKHVGPFQPKKYEFGYSASPVIYEDTVIVVGDQVKGGFLVALDRKTGRQAWRRDRPNDINYASPTMATINGRDQILIGGCGRIAAYDAATGKLLWQSAKSTAPQTCGTVVWEGDLVFASGGYPKKMTAAVRAGSGEVVWQNKKKCYEQSMLTHRGFLYALNDNGIAYCWRARDGKQMWAQRLKGPISASPVLVGDLIYAANERGTHFIFRAKPEAFELVAENQLGDEAFATPTIIGNRIFVRTAHFDDGGARNEVLYCLGE